METMTAKKSFTMPLLSLALIQTFTVWQMGVVYYSSGALTVSGAAPSPVGAENALLPMLLGYVFGAALSRLLPKRVGLWGRALCCASLVLTLLMLAPLSAGLLRIVYLASCFTCVSFISVQATLAVNVYSLRTALIDGVMSTIVSAPFVALLHLGPMELSFRAFAIVSAAIQILVLIGLRPVPLNKETDFLPPRRSLPPGERKRPPALLLWGTVFCYTIICLCVLFSGAAAESLANGIAVFYTAGAIWTGLFAYLCFARRISPFKLITVYLGIAALGFILWLLPLPALKGAAMALQGTGLALSGLAWFIAGVLFERWPSRAIAPGCVITALLSVLLHSGLLELLREDAALLYAVYAGIALVLLVVYFLTEPYFRRVWLDSDREKTAEESGETKIAELTKRENEVTRLLVRGYGSEDMARLLCISEHTVRTHVKNIYQKLGVHTRFELAAKVGAMERQP